MKTFTAVEWRDLARGCRALANMDEESRKKNEKTTAEAGFTASRKLHLEMAERCEHNASLVDRKGERVG